MTPPPARRVGSDTGGTFTDLVLDDGTIAKVPSTAHDPAEAVGRGLADLVPADPPVVLAHGTTVATNAVLERRGARVALVTNEGFADVIEIARQDRPSLYDQHVDRPEPLVPRRWRYEVRGRLAADGTELEPLDPATLAPIDPDVDAVAVCLLHSDLNPAHERAVAAELARRGHREVTLSCELSPEFREYERTVTAVVNAYVGPVCRSYLERLSALGGPAGVLVLSSAGGLVPAAEASAQPGRLLLSGPAGGALAGAAVAAANGWPDAVTFDMGGTSTDVCLVRDGRPEPAAERSVAGFPVRLPALDVHTIGAGGGSIAAVDDGGALLVGPASAGAVPGPACYGHGGTAATVTDANVVAGRLPPGVALPGIGPLDGDAARRALDAAGVRAEDVIAVVDAGMEQALRTVSVARGVDPRGLALVAFGGAGPLHACALADALEMPVVIVPPRAGVFSAVGVLGAPRQVDLVESWPTPADHTGLAEARRRLEAAAAEGLAGPVEVTGSLDCRYAGQSHELRVPSVADFAAEHERRNGYRRRGAPVEVIAVRATATVASPVSPGDLPAPPRRAATGPAVIAEPDCTVWVPPGWSATPAVGGALVLSREGRS
jgi:N-methylhydantoinase A/oxoprolinase/acetone carboxylase beta subunit